MLKYFFNCFLRLIGFPVFDNASGFYAIYKKYLEKLNLKSIYYGYGDYHLRLVYFARKNNFKIKEVPIKYGLRKSGQSKSKLLSMFILYLREAISLRFLK